MVDGTNMLALNNLFVGPTMVAQLCYRRVSPETVTRNAPSGTLWDDRRWETMDTAGDLGWMGGECCGFLVELVAWFFTLQELFWVFLWWIIFFQKQKRKLFNKQNRFIQPEVLKHRLFQKNTDSFGIGWKGNWHISMFLHSFLRGVLRDKISGYLIYDEMLWDLIRLFLRLFQYVILITLYNQAKQCLTAASKAHLPSSIRVPISHRTQILNRLWDVIIWLQLTQW